MISYVEQLHYKEIAVVVICIPLIVGVVFSIIYSVRKARINRVWNNSYRLKELLYINSETHFIENGLEDKYYIRNLPSKRAFDTFNLDDLFLEVIKDNKNLYLSITNSILNNRDLYAEYENKIDVISKKYQSENAATAKVNIKFFIEQEERLLRINKLRPKLDISIYCTKDYVSPKGRNHYSFRAVYNLDGLIYFLGVEKRMAEGRASVEHERAMMTDSLRYDVMKRDGFRCQICGRGANDGVKLHVDHILPVSKGGKTTLNNLRTLCEQCNMGKKDKYDPNGVN